MKEINQPEIYGSPRTAANTLIYILASAIMIGIAAIVPEYLIVKVLFVLYCVLLTTFGMYRSVRRVEISNDYIRIDTLISSFAVSPSDIVKIRECWSGTKIWFRGQRLPYRISWGYLSFQELQDLTRRLGKFSAPR